MLIKASAKKKHSPLQKQEKILKWPLEFISLYFHESLLFFIWIDNVFVSSLLIFYAFMNMLYKRRDKQTHLSSSKVNIMAMDRLLIPVEQEFLQTNW